jgi:hypothetical protein
VVTMQQVLKKWRHELPPMRKNIFAQILSLLLWRCVQNWEGPMLKFLLGALASIAMVGGAIAADLPRREPPPVAAPVGKAPIGKAPFGKGPVVARY